MLFHGIMLFHYYFHNNGYLLKRCLKCLGAVLQFVHLDKLLQQQHTKKLDFSGGPVVKNPPATTGDMG